MRVLGYTPGQWLTFVLLVFVALVIFQFLMNGARAIGGPAARIANRAEDLAGLR